MENKRLEFWYEFGSTYSYLSAMRIEAMADKHQIQIGWKPFLLGPIFKLQGWPDSPFVIYPAKGRYMWIDMQRQSHKRGLAFKKPGVFPRNGLLAARIAVLGSNHPWISEFTKKVYQANFEDDAEISRTTVLKNILKALDLDADVIISESQSVENKQRLISQTQEAVALGIFGAPSFTVGNELFWGDDRLENTIDFLLNQL